MSRTKSNCFWQRACIALSLGASFCLSQTAAAAEEVVSLRHTTTVLAIQAAEPAVVNIEGNKPANPAASNSQQVNGMGAGVIIDSRGYILTNQHVVQDVGRIEVTLHDGSKHVGRLIGRDGATDLALIEISPRSPLAVIRCGTSSDLMRGEPVIAIGNPFGYHHTVTEGIISALHRDIPVNGVQDYPDLIQTDASINPGNSGGPLLNADGDMIGINAAVRIGAQGIGFAIPVDRAIEVAASLIEKHRGSGIESPIKVKTRHRSGKNQLEVVSSAHSDLHQGDIVRSIGGRSIQNRLDYELSLLGKSAGEQIDVEVIRAGGPLAVQLRLDGRSTSNKVQLASTASLREQVDRTLGLQLEPADPETVQGIDPSYKGGLRVTSVRNGSPAYAAQIQNGDVLVGLLEWQTPNWDDLEWIMSSQEMRSAQAPKFHIMRGKEVYWGTLEMSGDRLR